MTTMNETNYHYTGAGLDYVYLQNGYTIEETPYGAGVAIEDLAGLHQAIARNVILSRSRLRGQELRFLRSMLDLSQAGLARVIGTTRPSIARWEGKPTTPIPPAADRALRMFFSLKIEGHELADKLVEVLGEIDELEYRLSLHETQNGTWRADLVAA
jgi:DNA-binding transcriptional regulator YiaG